MTRLMYDAVGVENIPSNATMVAGYVNGLYANLSQMDTRFPHATHVGISVSSKLNEGLVLDVENGDAAPSEAPGWVEMRRKAGIDPTVYCNASTWPQVQSAFKSSNITQPNYWIADYDNNPAIPAGAVAKQYASNDKYDTSSVASYWPGVDPKPVTTPPGEDVALTQADATLVVETLLKTNINEVGDTPGTRTVAQLLEYLDNHHTVLVNQISTMEKALASAIESIDTTVNAAVASAIKANGITATVVVNGTVK